MWDIYLSIIVLNVAVYKFTVLYNFLSDVVMTSLSAYINKATINKRYRHPKVQVIIDNLETLVTLGTQYTSTTTQELKHDILQTYILLLISLLNDFMYLLHDHIEYKHKRCSFSFICIFGGTNTSGNHLSRPCIF